MPSSEGISDCEQWNEEKKLPRERQQVEKTVGKDGHEG